MPSQCLVTSEEYAVHFQGRVARAYPEPVPAWDGVERRVGPKDRRQGHDRRWQAVSGRRFRVGDRRKP